MKTRFIAILFLAAFGLGSPSKAITVATVPIGNPGNPADTRYIDSSHPSGVGAVAYAFNIGKTEVTNGQYVAFLNAVAASDPYELYITDMGSSSYGGIARSGAAGSYAYAVKVPGLSGTYTYDDKPVIDVSSGDAMRFANWLHNGQPTGAEDATTTENGAYTLNGATGSALAAVTRDAGARWWLPNESEWYKAAYYNPGSGTYFDYPTSTNAVPNNNQPSSDTGNSANFYNNAFTTGNINYPLTDAGAYTLSASPYGTFDQGGNVWEWNETLFNGSSRGLRGGSWGNSSSRLHASYWDDFDVDGVGNIIGFRVASLSIPEPATLLLFAIGTVALICRRAGRKCRLFWA